MNIQDLLGSNPYFSAGAGVVGLTALSGLAFKTAGRAAFLLKRRLLVTIEIPIRDGIYPWVLEWMAKRNHINAQPEKLSLMERFISQRFHQLQVETRLTKHENGSISSSFSLVPGNGKHFFKYKSAWFQVERNRTSTMMNMTSGVPWETLSVTTLSRDRDLFLDMLQEAREYAMAQNSGKTIIHTAFGHEWRPFGNPRKKRPLESVVLNANISKDILDDVKQFLSSSQWYIDRGIPYRRGYLLYGPPGTGKSSFIQSLAGELDYNICIMNLSDQGMTDDRFAHLLNNLPPKCIILLEDIDAAFVDRSSANSTISSTHRTNSLTLSGLLNGLDGVVAAEERIVFMTTNYIDRLDNALARPGRCDYKIYLGNVTENQAQLMFSRFYSNIDDDNNLLTAAFVLKMKELNLIDVCSPAMLQSHFIMYRDNAKEAIINLEKVINS